MKYFILSTVFVFTALASADSFDDQSQSESNKQLFAGWNNRSDFFGPSCRLAKQQARAKATSAGYSLQDCEFIRMGKFSTCEASGNGREVTAYLICERF